MNEFQESNRRSGRKEPTVNRLFLAITVLYILVNILFRVLAARGVSLNLPVVLSLISGELVLFIPTVVYMVCARPKLRSLSERWKLPIAAVPLLILMAYCILPLISLVNLISMWLSGENAAVSLFGPMQSLPLWMSLLCVSLLPGFLEEFIFRGLIYSAYRKRRTWAAILTSALLFGLMHMNLNQMCYAFVMGVLFCLLYEGTGSLLASMLIHAVYNGNSVLMMYLMDGLSELEAESAVLAGQMMEGTAGTQMLITLIVIAIAALLGLAAAGGLYVAVVKLCGRGPYVKLLFQKNSMKRRQALAAGSVSKGLAAGDVGMAGGTDDVSNRLWGPFLWLGVFLSVGVIVWNLLAL